MQPQTPWMPLSNEPALSLNSNTARGTTLTQMHIGALSRQRFWPNVSTNHRMPIAAICSSSTKGPSDPHPQPLMGSGVSWCCKHHIAPQHILNPLLHDIALVLQALVFTMEVQQGQPDSRTHTCHHTATSTYTGTRVSSGKPPLALA